MNLGYDLPSITHEIDSGEIPIPEEFGETMY